MSSIKELTQKKVQRITINNVSFVYANGILINLHENTAFAVTSQELENDLKVFRKKSVFGEEGVKVIDIEVQREEE